MSTQIIVLSDSDDSDNDGDERNSSISSISSIRSASSASNRRRSEKSEKSVRAVTTRGKKGKGGHRSSREIMLSDSPSHATKEREAVGAAKAENLASLVRVAMETDSKRGGGGGSGGTVDVVPELYSWHKRVISAARHLRGSAEVTAQTGHPYRNGALHASDLRTLTQGKWLNDEVINCYLELVTDSCEGAAGRAGPGRRCLAMTTFFYTALTEHGYDYKRVQKWMRGAGPLASYDYVIIPVHRVCHWTLAVVDVRKRNIAYYDSFGRNEIGKQVCEHLSRWLIDVEDEMKANEIKDVEEIDKEESGEEEDDDDKEKEKEEEMDNEEGGEKSWNIIFPDGIPLQKNGSDCGVFTCKYAECVAFGIPFNFSQKDMPRIRDAMTYELVAKTLLIPFKTK